MAECEEKSGGSMILYSYWLSSCSWRVRIALAYKGLKYEYKAVNLATNDNWSEEFTKLNPLHMVPLLVDGGFKVSDSVAIMEYLEEKYPNPPLLPKDLEKRALIRQAVNCVTSSIQPLQNGVVLSIISKKFGAEESLKWAQYYIEKGFRALEADLKPVAGKYSFGDDFSLADIALVCQLGNAKRYEVDMAAHTTNLKKTIGGNVVCAGHALYSFRPLSWMLRRTDFPTLKRIGENIQDLPWVKETTPKMQPDAVV